MNINNRSTRTGQDQGISFNDFDEVRLTVAAEEDIRYLSYGEVTKPETINYRTQRPEKDGLFCEKIFGPEKDINPHHPRFKGVRSREAAVDKNGLLVTKAISRRQRMGHIELASPVVHPWFLKTNPSPIMQATGLKVRELERITYFRDRLILNINKPALNLLLKKTTEELDKVNLALEELEQELAGRQPEDEDLQKLSQLKNQRLDKSADISLIETFLEKENYSFLAESTYQQLPISIIKNIETGMGGEAIFEMLKNINLKKLIEQLKEETDKTKSSQAKKEIRRRLLTLEGMEQSGMKLQSMCLTILPVLPPKLRPIVQLTGGRFATSDLNDLYRRVINRNNRLKSLINDDAPEIICLNEKRMLQEAVDALIDNNARRASSPTVTAGASNRRLQSLTDVLKGKGGRFRQNLLGKRVDYSGRSVIISGPHLDIDECGLPKAMALEIFKPFVIGDLIANEHASNVKPAMRLIESGADVVWDALDRVIDGKYVLLNRAPTLHRLSVQAFRPKLIEGLAIELPPLVCKGFNADFDGDTMSVHLPLSDLAQAEARNLMTPIQNLRHPANGRPIIYLEQDIAMGLYYLTYDRFLGKKPHHLANISQALVALENNQITIHSPIVLKYRSKVQETTLGRVLLNEMLPEDFPYQNEPLTKKVLAKIVALVYELYDSQQTVKIVNSLKDLAFRSATDSGLSIGMNDFIDIAGKDEAVLRGSQRASAINQEFEDGLITEDERYRLVIQNWQEIDDKILELVSDQSSKSKTDLSIFVDSGAQGKVNANQVKRMTAIIGLQSDGSGRPIELPVLGNFCQGIDSMECFTATRGSRKTQIDVALSTADSGYLFRRLIFAVQSVVTTPVDKIKSPTEIADPGFYYYRSESEQINYPYGQRLTGRCLAGDLVIDGQKIGGRGDLISSEMGQLIEDSKVEKVLIMSVFSNRNPDSVPPECYGTYFRSNQLVEGNQLVGIVAAQSVGEPSTQLKLDSKHSGGGAGLDHKLVSVGLDRVIELVEARDPYGEAAISKIDGVVSIISQGDGSHQVTVQPNPDQPLKISLDWSQIQEKSLQVRQGQEVSYGQPLLVGWDWAAVCAPFDGKVVAIKKPEAANDSLDVLLAANKLETESYRLRPGTELLVKDGQEVRRGQFLGVGSANLSQLLETRGIQATQRYILNEISNVFIIQDNNHIPDKHFEIIVNQMFSKGKIIDAGDSSFSDDDFISRSDLIKANQELAAAGKQPAIWQALVLGITKIANLSDSFLSAVAFQETTKALVASAIRGRSDDLSGLLSNVCLGRLMPYGTGDFKNNEPASSPPEISQSPPKDAGSNQTSDSQVSLEAEKVN